MKWLQKVEKDKVKMKKLLKPGDGFESLDRKLAVALQAILPRDLEMRVQTDKAAMKKGSFDVGTPGIVAHLSSFAHEPEPVED